MSRRYPLWVYLVFIPVGTLAVLKDWIVSRVRGQR